MIKKAWEKDKRKVKKLVEGKSFDYFILFLMYAEILFLYLCICAGVQVHVK